MNIDSLKNICVVGFRRSGFYLTKLLLKLRKKVRVTEQKDVKFFPSGIVNKFRDFGVDFEFGAHTDKFIKDSDLIVISPGVDTKKSLVSRIAKMNNVPIVGEVEFASWLTKSKIVAITGTNGKTTTAFLAYRVIKSVKPNVYLAGNIGIPLSCCVLSTKPKDIIVLELSSFQLENIIEFRPYAACILNIEPDHLDRYSNFSEYIQAKFNIFRNQTLDDWAILNKNMFDVQRAANSIKSKIIYFDNELSNPNYSAVYRIAHIFGAAKADCIKVMSGFKGLPHRFQLVRKTKGIVFINDSKATNPASTVWALKNTRPPIVLIAGGKDKGLDYSAISPYYNKIVKVNLFGEAAHKIEASLRNRVCIDSFNSLEEAVEDAYRVSRKGTTVLFSPMCSSFDMFSNYIQRGNKFIEIVNSL